MLHKKIAYFLKSLGNAPERLIYSANSDHLSQMLHLYLTAGIVTILFIPFVDSKNLFLIQILASLVLFGQFRTKFKHMQLAVGWPYHYPYWNKRFNMWQAVMDETTEHLLALTIHIGFYGLITYTCGFGTYTVDGICDHYIICTVILLYAVARSYYVAKRIIRKTQVPAHIYENFAQNKILNESLETNWNIN